MIFNTNIKTFTTLLIKVPVLPILMMLCNIISASSAERIATLAAKKSVQSALNKAVELEKTNGELLIKLTEIPAPPFQESERALEFASLLKQAGLTDVSIDKVGNVIGVRPGTNKKGKRIAISAHLDTVFPAGTNVKVKLEGNKYTAPGIGDNTRGLVTVLSILKSLEHANIQTQESLLFIGNVGEEGLGDLRGIRYLFREQAEKIDEIIVVDGNSKNRIVTGGVGSHRYRVTFKGDGGHSWGAFGMANPHHALGRSIALFDEYAYELESQNKVKVSHSIGRIGGGTSVNSIPFESWFEVDMRSPSQPLIDKMDNILHKAIQKALVDENDQRTRGDALVVDIAPVGKRPAAKGNKEWQLILSMKSVMRFVGLEPKEAVSSTDASIPISLGIPALTISGGGSGGKAHSLDEYWVSDNAHEAVQISILTLLDRAGLSE
jgi:tripeptide aminopeptidase